jgi:signal transduction histidine kinase
MTLRLRWQVLWAPALALSVAGGLLAAEAAYRHRLAQRVAAVAQMREELDRVVLQIADRHARTIRRANEAVLDPRHANREAILAWTAEHYQKEMEAYDQEARASLATISLPGGDPRLADDLERLRGQLGRALDEAHAIAPVLDALLAAVSADDAEAVLTATQELERDDRVMEAVLRVAEGVARRTAIWQMQAALAAPRPVPLAAWGLLALWAPLSLVIAMRPLARLARLAAGASPRPASVEEQAIAARISTLEGREAELERQLNERRRELERATQTVRRADRELALLRLYNDNLVNSLRSAIVVTDGGLIVRGFNRVARLLLGLTDEALGNSIELLPIFAALAARTQGGRGALQQALTDRMALRLESLPYASGHGELLLDTTVAPYLDESGAARGLLWIADDVTDAMRTKSQLLAAERLAAVGRLSAQVAHEIRNPLSAIGLNAELLSDDFLDVLPEPRRSEAGKLLGAIANEIERLTEVTEGYLQLARLPRPALRDVDLNQVVGDLVSMLREEMNTYRIDILLDLATPAPHAWTDAGQLRQALLNVVRNSREAMPSGGRLRIGTRGNDHEAAIEVADNGPGIPADVLPRIFEPFFSTKAAGTGLGLSLTHQVITEHGGAVTAANAPEGGAVVTIALPRAALGASPDDDELEPSARGG